MTRRALVDTGVLAAYLNRRERHHGWAVEQLAAWPAPLLTSESVLSEALYLVRRVPGGVGGVLHLLRSGAVAPTFDLHAERLAVADLMEWYADIPMSLADACLVRLAELSDGAPVLTLDSDFHIYRKHAAEAVPVVSPGA